jgi:hypothetical protein
MVPLKNICWENGVMVEYVVQDTPQQYGKVERQFPTDLKRANAMLDTVKLSVAHKVKLRKKPSNMHQPWQISLLRTINHHMKNSLVYHQLLHQKHVLTLEGLEIY